MYAPSMVPSVISKLLLGGGVQRSRPQTPLDDHAVHAKSSGIRERTQGTLSQGPIAGSRTGRTRERHAPFLEIDGLGQKR